MEEEEGLFVAEKKVLRNLKKTALMVAGAAVQKFMANLSGEQEILMNIADMAIEIYVAESVLATGRETDPGSKAEAAVALQRQMALVYLHEAVEKVNNAGPGSYHFVCRRRRTAWNADGPEAVYQKLSR